MSALARVARVRFLLVIVSVLILSDESPGQVVFTPPKHTTVPVVLRLLARDAGSPPPSIGGDFTNWTPVRMKRHGNEWRFSVELSRGVYRFAFCSPDGKWFVPASFPNRTDDQMGGWVAVVVVS
jgi:hypothetical protein